VIRLGTRGSALALAQARIVADALAATGTASELVIVQTEGDRRAPDTAWGEGAFVVAIEHALLDGRADAAVHSAKDMPTDATPGLTVAAYLERGDPRDVLVVRAESAGWTLDTLPEGTRVGTDSPRRTAFLLARRPDLVLHPLHGNVDTRLRRLDEGQTDALVLAIAGLQRLGRDDRIAQVLDEDVAVPAPGQGAIAVQVRSDDPASAAAIGPLDHTPTRVAVEAERAFLAGTGGGCRAPIGALGRVEEDTLTLAGARARPDGSALRRGEVRGPAGSWEALAAELARRLAPRVLVTRAAGQSAALSAALREAGLQPVEVPTIEIRATGDLGPVHARLASFDWAIVTSASAARCLHGHDLAGPRWAAVGPATAHALRVPDVFVPTVAAAADLARELPLSAGDRVLLLRGDLADDALPERLRQRGATVEQVTVHRTIEGPNESAGLLRRALAEGVDVVVFTSGSTVRGLLTLDPSVTALPAVCIGEPTARIAREHGFAVAAIAESADPRALAAATLEVVG
jgi:hydroxymethylbilane synthase